MSKRELDREISPDEQLREVSLILMEAMRRVRRDDVPPGAIVTSRGWPADEDHAATFIPSLKITPATTSASNALPLSLRHFF